MWILTDINECAHDDSNNCNEYENQYCTNIEGSYNCDCKPGFTQKGAESDLHCTGTSYIM